jgi:toxin-antitoxin system PIN domain toxin
MTYLPDVNVWIASVVPGHVQHNSAMAWFAEAENDTVAFCRVTQMGFLRLLTNPRVMDESVLTAGAAWNLLEKIRRDARILFAPEPAGMERAWREGTTQHWNGPNFWTDSFLAAFARVTGHTLVTFDRGFSKYKAISARILLGT